MTKSTLRRASRALRAAARVIPFPLARQRGRIDSIRGLAAYIRERLSDDALVFDLKGSSLRDVLPGGEERESRMNLWWSTVSESGLRPIWTLSIDELPGKPGALAILRSTVSGVMLKRGFLFSDPGALWKAVQRVVWPE